MRNMKIPFLTILFGLFILPLQMPAQMKSTMPSRTDSVTTQRVVVYFEGPAREENLGRGDAYQLAQLMGHFHTDTDVRSVEEYRDGDMDAFDAVFFIGYTLDCRTPKIFMQNLHKRKRTAVWLHTGILHYAEQYDLDARYGFHPERVDTVQGWSRVFRGEQMFTKSEPNITLCRVTDATKCTVHAIAENRRKGSTPYIMQSGKFWYVADSPFALADERDRYLLFADMLHDILGEDHPESHRAIVRIEDVHPLEDPDRLRDLADLLEDEGVPFLIALIPYYINPERGIRVSLTDKPDFVDAIHYMVEKGGAVTLHGATHQYRGITAADYEFWDINAGGPIKDETVQYVRSKITNSLEECIRNGIYPIIWETPHYTGSMTTYDGVATIFSSAMEQRSAINSAAYGQIFPYIIYRDIHGQKIYPENLGYVQLDPGDPEVARRQVGFMLGHADVNYAVRDGFASFFFHSFVPHENLRRLVRGIRERGFTFIDPQRMYNRVQLQDKAILTGGGEIAIELRDQYLREYWFARDGEVLRTEVSSARQTGLVKRKITLEDGQLYLATPTEIKQYDEGLFTSVKRTLRSWYDDLFTEEDTRDELSVTVLWDSTATGGAMRDQQSFAAAFQSVGAKVDTLHLGGRFRKEYCRLLAVPYAAVENLRNPQFSELVEWIRHGGRAVTDGHNEFSLELGMKYTGTSVRLTGLRERLYPEDDVLWNESTAFRKFEVESDDVIYAADPETEAPVVISRAFGEGRFLYLGTRLDPHTDMGVSRYPFLIQYVAKDMDLHPVFRRDALEVYFDPGFRSAIPVESLVRRWVTHGVRAVYVGSWHDYHTYTYDYERLVRLCHENGILIYAWLEPPQISHKFWEEHPEWREKNVYGKDNRASWRYPLAMTDSACVGAMMREYASFLRQHDFDGVNIAETYFESDVRGPAEPGNYAPMHPSARKEFAALQGFDPALLFEQGGRYYWKDNPRALRLFEDYRVQKVVDMHRRLLQLAYEIRNERPGFSVLVTMLDNLGSPGLRASQGIDIERIIALDEEYPFTLIVEDPMARWSESPRRYHAIASRYRQLMGDDFALDINILSFRSKETPTMFPTLVQSGIEAFSLYQVASSEVDRTVVYAESSINPHDFPMLSYASTGKVRWKHVPGGYEIFSPHAVTLELSPSQKYVLIDGALRTSAGDGRFLIPAGRHHVQLESQGEALLESGVLHATLLSCTGTLLSLDEGERSVSFTYRSAERCYVTINKKPVEILIDGEKRELPVREGIMRYSVRLPDGEHRVQIITSGAVSYSIDLTSLWSSTLIVLFGAVALVLLGLLYIVTRIRRRRHPLPTAPPQIVRSR
ncbi:polysaccharide deacetylase family protein [bacterium]|nr:polysaccharide deacetylase family protein [bacterium]